MKKNPKCLDHGCSYPMFVSLERRVCLVVGGGSVAERKVRSLLQHGASVRIIALRLNDWLEAQSQNGRIRFLGSAYEDDCLDDVDLVFATTDDKALNAAIAEAARKRKIWCNMATDPELGSFIVPSVLQRGPMTVAVSTGGASPALAKRIREELEEQFGREWAVFLNLMASLRELIQGKGLESMENQRIFRIIAALPIPEWIAEQQRELVLDAIHRSCRPLVDRDELNRILDSVWK